MPRLFLVLCFYLGLGGLVHAELSPLDAVLGRLAEDTILQTQALAEEREALAARRKALEARLVRLRVENGEKRKVLDGLIEKTRRMEAVRKTSELTGAALAAQQLEAEERFRSLLAPSLTYPLFPLPGREGMGALSSARLETFLEALRFHLQACDHVAVHPITFLAKDGREKPGQLLRVGALAGLAVDGQGKPLFVLPHDKDAVYREAEHSPSWREGRAIRKGVAGEAQILPLDLSRGLVLSGNGGRRGLQAALREGGLLLWPILFIGLVGFGIFLIRGFVLFRLRFCKEETLHLVDVLQDGERALCMEKEARSPALSVVALAVRLRHETVLFREQAVEAAAAAWSDRMEKGLATLGVMAALAPMLGLLGTVTGMMASFRVMSQMGAGDVRLMSGGISEALITTQWGLGVAVPLLLAHHLLSRRAERLAFEAEDRGMEALALLEKGEAP